MLVREKRASKKESEKGTNRTKTLNRTTYLLIPTTLALTLILACFTVKAAAQDTLPFTVSNPKHMNWSMDEATRIYDSACQMVARSVRPEKPPRLQPTFVLVLGAKEDETVRMGSTSEVHLKTWSAPRFAQAMVYLAEREILRNEDILQITHDVLLATEASVSVAELRQKH
jgi:hypothetical protein